MKEKAFIQLINLFIDEEITEPELRALRIEIDRSEKRRELFESYCSFCRASQTSMLEAVETDSASVSSNLIQWPRVAASALAAAACLALSFAAVNYWLNRPADAVDGLQSPQLAADKPAESPPALAAASESEPMQSPDMAVESAFSPLDEYARLASFDTVSAREPLSEHADTEALLFMIESGSEEQQLNRLFHGRDTQPLNWQSPYGYGHGPYRQSSQSGFSARPASFHPLTRPIAP